MKILVLNAGSSSQKSCLYEIGETLPQLPPQPLWEAKIDWTRQVNTAEMKVKTSSGAVLETEFAVDSRGEIIAKMLETLWQGKTQVLAALAEIDAVGHRVVHGGLGYQEPTLVTPEVKETIKRLFPLAPAHNPANLEGIETVEQALSSTRLIPQVAVFDTAFHQTLPPAAAVYPGPYEWFERGIRRYGFHGISHQYCAERAVEILRQSPKEDSPFPSPHARLINCHLGNGCSLTAINRGRSVDTTMGFTPMEGLMMGSRSGSIDPGILIYLMREEQYDLEKLDYILNKESGLKGVSGVSSDLRQIQAAIEQDNDRAKLAFEIYIHRLRSQIGSMLAVLGGADAIIFTGGVGENSPTVRAKACEAFEFIGLKIDSQKNANCPVDIDIATADSTVRILVIQTQEDWAIAKKCWHLVRR